MTPKELSHKHGISIQEIGQKCARGDFEIQGIGYHATNIGKGKKTVWDIAFNDRRRTETGSLREIKERATIAKLISQGKLLEQQLKEKLYGDFLVWADVLKEKLIESGANYSTRITALKLSPETIIEINKAFSECMEKTSLELSGELSTRLFGQDKA